jgi:hypothetical protein
MWTEITRGMAALIGVWSVAPAVERGECVNLADKDLVSDFLSEAEKYLETGRHQGAAILAGDALEGTLRKLCAANCVAVSAKASAEVMNTELAGRGVYDDQMQERLHRAASVSDKANCGLWSEFSEDDVELMLAEVRAFAAEHASV